MSWLSLRVDVICTVGIGLIVRMDIKSLLLLAVAGLIFFCTPRLSRMHTALLLSISMYLLLAVSCELCRACYCGCGRFSVPLSVASFLVACCCFLGRLPGLSLLCRRLRNL